MRVRSAQENAKFKKLSEEEVSMILHGFHLRIAERRDRELIDKSDLKMIESDKDSFVQN